MIDSKGSEHTCPSCGHKGMSIFYEVDGVPVHSVLLMETREKALSYPRGNITLGLCEQCGFIGNTSFNPALHEYSAKYEETQGFSETFNAFHQSLARQLIDQFDLHNKDVIEIGCGKGEFLTLLVEMGENRGVGFDPAYVSERNHSLVKDRITFIQDFYSEKYTKYHGDFVCCKMTLEHIPNTAEFIATVRRSVGDRIATAVFFQIPEVMRILKERAFWDIYYEHCSYFSPGSLARLFRRCGFDVLKLWKGYDDQYLMIEAKPRTGGALPPLSQENDIEEVKREVADFTLHIQQFIETWEKRLQGFVRDGKKAVIWGGGSKGVAFLTKLNVRDQIQYAVDINPYKHGTFMAGTGQEIVSPKFLQTYRPDIVIVMNPIYCDEIRGDLKTLGVPAEIIPITA